MSIHLRRFFVYTKSEDSGQCVHMRTLALAFFVETAISINIDVLAHTSEPARNA